MEALQGKWEFIGDDITGMDEYIATTGQLGEKEALSKRKVLEIVGSVESCSITVNQEGLPPFEFKCNLGERTELNVPGKETVFVTMTIKDGVIYQKKEVGDVVIDSKSFVQDGILIQEDTANGKTMVTRLRKI